MRDSIIYKEFYAAPKPVILCEGKTDIVYIHHAIRNLAADYPRLATISADKTVTLLVRLFRYSQTSTGRILKLTGGTGDLNNFLWQYIKEIKKFKVSGQRSPVIFLIDNDEGANPIQNSVQTLTKSKLTRTESFVHIVENLYLVFTPLKAGETKSAIEDSFTKQTLGIVLSGKSFDRTNDSDSEKHFGKHVFSMHVEKNAGRTDFSGFAEILTRLTAVIEAHHNANT